MDEYKVINPRSLINKAFMKVKPIRKEFDTFEENMINLMNLINENESEEYHKNLISHFLKDTYYGTDFFINTKDRKDLVIHNGKEANSSVGVILEVKKPLNKSEMPKKDNINSKALQEILLYYLRERISKKNYDIKHLIVTNVYEWFVFDAHLFERLFARNKKLTRRFEEFENGRLSGTTTDFFYKEIAEPVINGIHKEDITFCYFDIRKYKNSLKANTQKEESKLIALYKLFSPENLLRLPFQNDSNSLNKTFYSELLHIIGLSEKKEGSKRIIGRRDKGSRNLGSLIENTINQLDTLDKISRVKKPSQYGKTYEERLFNIALQMVITWTNRILFLKLLEAQLVNFHKGDKRYSFLNESKIKSFDDLNRLFFGVLAKRLIERNEDVRSFSYVPYLNSSLFEPTELEHSCFFISQLDEMEIRIYSSTVIKDSQGRKRTGSINTLDYLFRFLDSYDFGSDGGEEEIQEESKTLISASVLGLVFEKINGYKDGSFFTPGYITMFMSREAIRRTVIQKFNKIMGWNCKNFKDLYNKIDNKEQANEIINSIKICDPAVGSGHFLVSALNELIAIKSELKILTDREGRTLRDYNIEVANDELIVTDDDGRLFTYNPNIKESQRIQEALFHEKKNIIENCLFGVDINPNSVNICRLRLWIELLKNAYYKSNNELETLPNIDINIKCGNSLVSRYPLDSSIGKITKKSKFTIADYVHAVSAYRNAQDKTEKREMETLISQIKDNFETEISFLDKRKEKLRKLKGELYETTNQLELFEKTTDEKRVHKRKVKKIQEEIDKLEKVLEEIKNNKIYEDAFEWRIEFPEVLDEKGRFIGFDVVIGNPPYMYRNAEISHLKDYFRGNYFNSSGNYDLYKYFIEKAVSITAQNGINCLITNSSFLLQDSFSKTRQFLLENTAIELLVPLGPNVFEEATVDTVIYLISVKKVDDNYTEVILPYSPKHILHEKGYIINQARFGKNNEFAFDCYLNTEEFKIKNKVFENFPPIEKGFEFGVGINTGYIKAELTSDYKIDNRYHPMVAGSGISRYGSVNTTGYIMYDKEFVKSKGKLGRALPDEKFFTEDKILVVRTRNLSLNRRIISTLDTNKKYNLNRLSNIIARNGYNIYGLLGILNSNLFNWLYSKRFLDYEIKPTYLKISPLADTNNLELIQLVKERLNVKESDSSKAEKLEKQIDQLVYRLYQLTDDEVEIIESSLY